MLYRQFYACIQPKVGCTSWLKYIRSLHLPPDVLRAFDIHPYRRESFDQHGLHFRNTQTGGPFEARSTEDVINGGDFFKFAVVRHPWDRIISAYNSKYLVACKSSRTCLRSAFSMTELDVSKPTAKVTFDEFVRSIALQNPITIDQHFRPSSTLCELSRIHYDYLADLDSQEHASDIASILNLPTAFTVKSAFSASSNLSDVKELRSVYAPLPCTYETVAAAEYVYGEDARLLGYSFDDAYVSCNTYGLTSAPLSADQHKELESNKKRKPRTTTTTSHKVDGGNGESESAAFLRQQEEELQRQDKH